MCRGLVMDYWAKPGLDRRQAWVAMAMGLIRLLEVAIDGTRVKANASRYHTWTAAKTQAALEELEAKFAQMLEEDQQADAAETAIWGERLTPLPPELAKSCFVYDEAADVYYCPMGRALAYEETKKIERKSGPVKLRLYRCEQCATCPLASVKAILGVRQFLLRGLEKVRTEWLWVCTAYNLKKLISAVARLRAQAATAGTAMGN